MGWTIDRGRTSLPWAPQRFFGGQGWGQEVPAGGWRLLNRRNLWWWWGPQVLREPWEVRFNEARVAPPKVPGSQAAGGLWG